MAEPVLRRGSRADAEGICTLLRRAFPDNPKARREVLDWQYWDNPFGKPTVWLWEEAGRVLGCYAVIPYPARLDGRPARLGIGIDAAIDPDAQGRGLFGPLTTALYADALAHDVDAIVCYPNENSVRGIARHGWTELGQLRSFLLPLAPDWYARRLGVPVRALAPLVRLASTRARRGGAGLETAEVDAVDAGADALEAGLPGRTLNGVVRDRAWLQWRYVARPGPRPYRFFTARRNGGLQALAVTTEREQQGGRFTCLLELLAVDGPAARAVVARIAADSTGSAGVLLAALPNTPLARRAAAAGLWAVPARLEDKPLHFGVVGGTPGTAPAWSLGWGDLDHL